MEGIKFNMVYTWDLPLDSIDFDHYVQLHEQRVSILRKGKKLRYICCLPCNWSWNGFEFNNVISYYTGRMASLFKWYIKVYTYLWHHLKNLDNSTKNNTYNRLSIKKLSFTNKLQTCLKQMTTGRSWCWPTRSSRRFYCPCKCV